MPDARIEFTDAVELAEMLEFIARWLSGDQRQTLADSFAAFMGPHTTYRTDDLIADLHRFVFLLGVSDAKNSSVTSHHDQQTGPRTART